MSFEGGILVTTPNDNQLISKFFDNLTNKINEVNLNGFYSKTSGINSINMDTKDSRSTKYRSDLRTVGEDFKSAYGNKVFIIVLHDYYDEEDNTLLYAHNLIKKEVIQDLNNYFRKDNIMTRIIDHGINNDNNDIVNEFNEMGIFGVNIYIKNNTDERLQYIVNSLVAYIITIYEYEKYSNSGYNGHKYNGHKYNGHKYNGYNGHSPTRHSSPTRRIRPTRHSSPTRRIRPTRHSSPTRRIRPTRHSSPTRRSYSPTRHEYNNVNNDNLSLESSPDNETRYYRYS